MIPKYRSYSYIPFYELVGKEWVGKWCMCEVLMLNLSNGTMRVRYAKGGTANMNIDNLMQFTGHKDKDGQEIYAGDLISTFGAGDKPTAEIVFEPFGGWCFKWIDKTYINVRGNQPEPVFRNIGLFKKVGNIHENPLRP